MATADSYEGSAPELSLTRGNVQVSWVSLGESLLGGDFDPAEPGDVEVLRFDVYEKIGGEWEAVDDASYCTQVPVDTDTELLKQHLLQIMNTVYDRVMRGESIKKICESLSWLPEDPYGVLGERS